MTIKLASNVKFAICAIVAGALFVSVAPVSNAANVTYANAVGASEWQYISSGVATISGGEAEVDLFISQVYVGIETYLSFPGFSSYAKALGPSTQIVTMSHARVTNYLSRCWWRLAGSQPLEGEADLTCSYKN